MPTVNDVFDLQGNERQNQIVRDALTICDYPFHRLVPGLKEQRNKTQIPVVWEDLSRWAAAGDSSSSQVPDHGHEHTHEPGYEHDSIDKEENNAGHKHVTGEDGDEGHVLEYRKRVLGLAWYSGKISIERTLVDDPELAKEVFLSEAAHMIDFFALMPWQRFEIFAAYHPEMSQEELDDHSEHGWFEETGNNDYWSWVGESWMSGFIYAFSSLLPRIADHFTHRSTPTLGKILRTIVLMGWYFARKKGKTFHWKTHLWTRREVEWRTYQEAVAAGRRPCKVCRPTERSA